MMSYFWIFLGGGLGSMARFAGGGVVGRYLGETFPWGTLLINITGCLVIGFFAEVTGPHGRWVVPVTLRQFFIIGVCGGYTTFSAFSLQTLVLAQTGQWFKAGANAVLSLVLCLLAVWIGHLLASWVNP